MRRIAIQGIEGSFHDIASHEYFQGEEVELICCRTFEEVFAELDADPTVMALCAIENTIAGSLLHNYELLRLSSARIVGELKLHISHSIMCLPEDDWTTITEVHSHPVALQQCRDFLSHHPEFKAVEDEDTAGSARDIAVGHLRGRAAICSKFAAERFGLKVLEEQIETNKHNFTRFMVLCHQSRTAVQRDLAEVNKASIVFTLPHEEGSLSQVLSIFSFYKVNLTKIQSLPIIGQEWHYLFYVDVTYSDYKRYCQSIDAITPLTKELKILGEYKDGRQVL